MKIDICNINTNESEYFSENDELRQVELGNAQPGKAFFSEDCTVNNASIIARIGDAGLAISSDALMRFNKASDGELNAMLDKIVLQLESYKSIAYYYSGLVENGYVCFKITLNNSMQCMELLCKQKDQIDLILQNRRIQTLKPVIASCTQRLIESKNAEIWEKEGCFYRPKSQFKFSEEFNEKLFQEYSATPNKTEKERINPYITQDNEEMIVCELCYKDLNRSRYVLIDQSGTKCELTSESFPNAETKGSKSLCQLQQEWKQDRIAIFLQFCDGDKDKLFKLSQCMCQEMGNGYYGTLVRNESIAPQRIAGINFSISTNDQGVKLERYFKLTKARDGSIILRYIDKISNICNIVYNYDIVSTDPRTTNYYLQTGIVLDANGNWMPYEEGGIEYAIVALRNKNKIE